jgi:N-hydroxyarylamine O-acetyltransferase
LIAGKAAPGCRYTLMNDQFAIHYADGRTERRKLSNAAEIRNVLVSTFGLRLPRASELDSALERLLAAEPAEAVAR